MLWGCRLVQPVQPCARLGSLYEEVEKEAEAGQGRWTLWPLHYQLQQEQWSWTQVRLQRYGLQRSYCLLAVLHQV